MLYIEKTKPKPSLIEWIEKQENPSYDGLKTNNETVDSYLAYTELRTQLWEEQRHLCCYCMQPITADSENSNIEHFLPQSLFPYEDVNYYNLYLACIVSRDFSKQNQHCDIAKGNELISKYIGYYNKKTGNKCQDFFKYTDDGYILPNRNGYNSLNRFYIDYMKLTAPEKELLGTIEILNLNCPSLLEAREKFIKDEPGIKNTVNSLSDITLLEKLLQRYENTSMMFAGIAIYFIKTRIDVLKNNSKK